MTYKHFGKSCSPNLMLKKAVNENNELANWYWENVKGEKITRKTLSVILMDASFEEIKRWNFYRAFPCRWKAPSFDATDNNYAVETIEIVYE